jgi:hypothetical protein
VKAAPLRRGFLFEFAYGPATGLPDSKVGTFTPALYDEANKNGWTVISMKIRWLAHYCDSAAMVPAGVKTGGIFVSTTIP